MNSRKVFVLDLFTIKAIISEDEDLYGRTIALLQLIKDKCHKVVMTPALHREYSRKIKDLEKTKKYTYDRLLKKIKGLLIAGDNKVFMVNEPGYNIPGVPAKDQIIVKPAIARQGAIIVTTNRKHLINNQNLKSRGINVVSLEDVFKLL